MIKSISMGTQSNMKKGIVYLVQPAELVGCNRYKVGRSKHLDLRRVIEGYNKGTRFLVIIETYIKKLFRQQYVCVSGTEYFECEDECQARRLFFDTVYLGVCVRDCLT